METLVKQGLTKAIGVSNYNVQSLMNLLSFAEILPAVNQIEANPFLPNKNLIKFCQDSGVQVMVYNSLCKNSYAKNNTEINLFEQEFVKSLAKEHNCSEGIIALSWAVSQNLIAIPGSSNPDRMKSNLKTLEVKLSADEISKLSNLENSARGIDPKTLDTFRYIDLFA